MAWLRSRGGPPRGQLAGMRWRVAASSIGLLLLVGLLGSRNVVAHAVLLKATPSSSQSLTQAPDLVQLLFSEPLDPVFSAVRVLNASGQAVDRGNSHVDPNNEQLL